MEPLQQVVMNSATTSVAMHKSSRRKLAAAIIMEMLESQGLFVINSGCCPITAHAYEDIVNVKTMNIGEIIAMAAIVGLALHWEPVVVSWLLLSVFDGCDDLLQ